MLWLLFYYAFMAHKHYLQMMGIEVWQLRHRTQSDGVVAPVIDNQSSSSSVDWERLAQQVACCRLCGLEKTRTQTVFGSGNRQADLMLVGEAPGADEDRQGQPFVGRAGRLLTLMLQAVAIKRSEVFIANILKCRPPNNRDPNPNEVRCCTPYLQNQINLIAPKLIVALGRVAGQFLLSTSAPLARLRGQIYHYGEKNTPLFVTYHPAYLLRSPSQKAKSYQDLRRICDFLSNH